MNNKDETVEMSDVLQRQKNPSKLLGFSKLNKDYNKIIKFKRKIKGAESEIINEKELHI
jgi:hypothetical protein